MVTQTVKPLDYAVLGDLAVSVADSSTMQVKNIFNIGSLLWLEKTKVIAIVKGN